MSDATRLGSGEMFDAISARYDLMNRIMSFGVDRGWRKKAIAALELSPEKRVLDVATGTADIALGIARADAGVRIVGVDPSAGMLAVAKTKIEQAGAADRIELEVAQAEQLPFEDSAFDATVIAFGIRNVVERERGISEMRRVTKPGGRVVVLELSEPRRSGVGHFAHFHVHTLVPMMGSLLSGAREYGYLQRSIAAFPSSEKFAAMLTDVGLEVEQVVPLTFGVAHLFVSRRPRAT